MARVVRAEGPILQRIVATTPLVACGGLSPDAFVKYEAAQAKTAWALGHRHRFALVQDNDVLASAECYDLAGQLDGQPVSANAEVGTVDWRLGFPDGGVGLAQSRVTETTRGTCIYTFVLHAPPVALEHIEGALETQSRTLRSELTTLKALMEA